MNQQRAIRTAWRWQANVPIARSLMSWYAFSFSCEEYIISSSTLCFTAFCRILPYFSASVLCPSAMVRVTARPEQECSAPPGRKLVILVLVSVCLKCTLVQGLTVGNSADVSVFARPFRALFSFPFRFGGHPKGYMDCVEAAWASSAAQHRQIPDEKYVGFLPCARPARQAHLAQATRSAWHRRYLIPDLAAVSTTNVNFPITFVVVLPRRIGYSCLIGFSLLEREPWGKNFVALHTGGDQLEQLGPEEIRFQLSEQGYIGTPVLDFPGRESYSFQKQKTRQVVW